MPEELVFDTTGKEGEVVDRWVGRVLLLWVNTMLPDAGFGREGREPEIMNIFSTIFYHISENMSEILHRDDQNNVVDQVDKGIPNKWKWEWLQKIVSIDVKNSCWLVTV